MTPGPVATGPPAVRHRAEGVVEDAAVWSRAAGGWERGEDTVAAEEPLEIRIEHAGRNEPLAVTMRTPGDDLVLAAGFLFTEGVVEKRADLVEVKHCPEPGPDGRMLFNVVQAFLHPNLAFDMDRFRRNVFANSSCGVCGKASIDAVEVACDRLAVEGPVVDLAVLRGIPDALRSAQQAFATTGGLHATARVRPDGTVVDLAEDVGRHNAMDKVVGRAFFSEALPLAGEVLAVSGRVSFEIVQKTARAGAPVVAALGAPSSLALSTAERLGITVVGFLANGRGNVYTHPSRITA